MSISNKSVTSHVMKKPHFYPIHFSVFQIDFVQKNDTLHIQPSYPL